jgi:hypothetical protein
MAEFFEEEPEDWADEQRIAEQHYAQPQPPEEYEPDAWELDAAAAAAAAQRAQPASKYDPSAPSARGGCRDCDSFTFDQRWREAFGVYLCAAVHSRRRVRSSHDCVLQVSGSQSPSFLQERAGADLQGTQHPCAACAAVRGWRPVSRSNVVGTYRGQGKAKEKFMLTDGDLKKLGSLSKSNPQKKEWSAMKLYLLEQVWPLPGLSYQTAARYRPT